MRALFISSSKISVGKVSITAVFGTFWIIHWHCLQNRNKLLSNWCVLKDVEFEHFWWDSLSPSFGVVIEKPRNWRGTLELLISVLWTKREARFSRDYNLIRKPIYPCQGSNMSSTYGPDPMLLPQMTSHVRH